MARKNGVRFPGLVLTIGFDRPSGSDGFAHVRGWITRDDGRLLYSSDEEMGGKFKGVMFSAQADNDSFAQENRPNPLYGYKVEWKGDDKGLSELKRGVVALTEIERKMDKAYEQFGPPASFGAWVQRLAGAIGLDQVRIPDRGYRSPQEAAYAIDAQVQEWRRLARERRGLAA